MAVTTSYSATIRGTVYNYGTKFTCAQSVTGNGKSEGGGSLCYLTQGEQYTFYGMASGDTVIYPYGVMTANATSESDIIGWFPIEAFPDNTTETYTIQYTGNVADGITLGGKVPDSQTKTAGVDLVLSTDQPTREGYGFKGWRALYIGETESDTRTIGGYQPGETFTHDCSVTMFAIWGANITYHQNEINSLIVNGMPNNTSKMLREPFTIPNVMPTMEGYTFIGWALSEENADAETPVVEYTAASIVAGTAVYDQDIPVDLYAVWTIDYDDPEISGVEIVRWTTDNAEGTESAIGKYLKVSFNWKVDDELTFKKGSVECGKYLDVIDAIDSSSGSYTTYLGGDLSPAEDCPVSIMVIDSSTDVTTVNQTFAAEPYTAPTIINPKVVRVDGTHALVTFDWTIDGMNGVNTVSDIYVNYLESGSDIVPYVVEVEFDPAATNGTVEVSIDNYDFNAGKAYDFTITVEDQVSSTAEHVALTYAFHTMHWKPGGKGIAIGKASSDDIFDVAMESKFRENVSVSTVNGYPYGSNKELWTGYLHMADGHVITLKEKVSQQPHGICLVFSEYDNINDVVLDQGFWSEFVPKAMVEWWPGKFHVFAKAAWADDSAVYKKGLYIYDEAIRGHASNTNVERLEAANNHCILRAVIGV